MMPEEFEELTAPPLLTNQQAYDDIVALGDVIRRVKELSREAIRDGRYVEPKVLKHLREALPDLMLDFDSVADEIEAARKRLFDLIHPAQQQAASDTARHAPFIVLSVAGTKSVEEVLIDRRLIGPAGRAKLRPFWDAYWGWDKKHGRRWLRRTIKAGMVPIRSLVDGLPVVGAGIGEAMDVLADAVKEWKED